MKKTDGKTEESSLTAQKHEHGKHPNSLANLKPFEKGISGNPAGRSSKFIQFKKLQILDIFVCFLQKI